MSDDRTEALRRERRRFFWKLDGEILFSDAFKEISRDGQTVTIYLLILARQPIPPKKKDRTRLEKLGLWPPKDSSFSFPVREAPYHGLTVRGLAHGLQRLHEVGIIDRIKSGSAIKGDFALYRLSNRWRSFGNIHAFETLPWPKANTIGARGEGGMFIRRRGRKVPVVANPTTTKTPLMANLTTTTPPVVAESTINTCGKPRSVVADSTMLLSAPSLSEDSEVSREVKKRTRTLNPRSKDAAAPIRRDDATPKQWRPPLSEIRENITEILRQRPDPRADDPRFVRFLADQLLDAQRGKLNPGRVHHDLQERHDLDDWTTDLLFTVAIINLQFRGATN